MGEKYYDGAKKTMVYIDAQFYLEELKMTANYVTEEVYIQGCLRYLKKKLFISKN